MVTEIPELRVILGIQWQFFGTLTFETERIPTVRMKRMLFAHLRTVAKWWHRPFNKLLWVVRFEHGELTGRPHYHVLISGLPTQAVSGGTRFERASGSWDYKNRTCHAFEENWRNMGIPKDSNRRRRIAEYSLYDMQRDGVGYVTKCLAMDEVTRASKDAYETAKFGSKGVDELILAHSVENFRRVTLKRQPRGLQ